MSLNPEIFQNLLLSEKKEIPNLKPLTHFQKTSIFIPCPEGDKEIASGRVACILLAGGDGSRMGTDLPKGLFPIQGKTLFERFFEKVKAKSLSYETPLQVAVMLSPLNKKACEKYFKEKNWFGLKKEQIVIFEQQTLPCLDENGNFISQKEGSLLKAPSGNGEVFHYMKHQGILERFKNQNITSLQILPIDNPLAIPFDPQVALLHQTQKADLVIKACERISERESVGLLTENSVYPYVAEYSEIPEKFKTAKDAKGHLLFAWANTGLLSFTLSFAEKAASQTLPLHIARKKIKGIEKPILKLETFIFDLFSHVEKWSTLIYPREEIFAPLKNSHDVEAVEKALLLQDKSFKQRAV